MYYGPSNNKGTFSNFTSHTESSTVLSSCNSQTLPPKLKNSKSNESLLKGYHNSRGRNTNYID